MSTSGMFELLQHVPLGICMLAQDYAVLYCNRTLCNWIETDPQDITGKNLLELYPHLGEGKYKTRLDQVMDGGPPCVFSPQLHPHFLPSLLPNGKHRIQQTTVVSQLVEGDRVLMICMQDVTEIISQVRRIHELQRITLREMNERKKALQELEEANRYLVEFNEEKDRIMQIITHDIRSPVSGIKGAAELLASDPADVATVAEFSAMIVNVADSLLTLVNDFLDLAKLQAGKITLNPAPYSITAVARQAIEFFEVTAANKNVTVTPAFDGEIIVDIDRSKMLQVLTNLLSNAIKFTRAGGVVTLAVERETNGDAVLRVQDTGVGIAEEHLAIVFEQFGSHQRQGTAGEKGTGLGMPLVKSFVELHGGTIAVSSEVGKGTTFTIRLPQAQLCPDNEESKVW